MRLKQHILELAEQRIQAFLGADTNALERILSDDFTFFTSVGYEATTVRRQGWGGLTDEDLWPRVQAERRWLVTADKAFGDVRLFALMELVGR